MNKKYALPAIAMFAVIMGMSAFAPAAMADRNSNHGKTTICHFDYNDMVWEADKEVNPHALVAHLGHDDQIIFNAEQQSGTITVDECLAQDPLPPKVI